MNRIIIIGAGPAGITAGCELAEKTEGSEIIILEGSDTAGGISRTVCVDGNRMDMGGHRFFSKNEDVMNWWKELMPVQGSPSYDDRILGRPYEICEGGPNPEIEDTVFLKRNRVSRIYYRKHFFDYPVTMNVATVKNLGLGTTLCAGFSYLKAMIFRRRENSLEDFYINRFGRKLYSTFFEGYTEKLWGRHPREISPDWGAQRVKGLSIMAVLKDIFHKLVHLEKKDIETSLIESFYYPKYGPGQLWEAAASRFQSRGGRIMYGCRVKQVCIKDGRVRSVIYKKDGNENEIEADAVFSSMPVKDLAAGMDNMPEDIKNIAEGLPYRDFVTVGLLVDRLLLKNETDTRTLGDIVPDCWIYVQDKGIRMGRIQIFNNWSPYMVEDPEHKVWIGLEYFCNENDRMWNMSEEEWLEMGTSELVTMGILESNARVETYHCEKVQKAYPAYFDTYEDIDRLEKWLNNVDGLYCIGRNGQHRYNNMDHSMLTAMEAVRVYCGQEQDKSVIWKVNTEKEYHEEEKRN